MATKRKPNASTLLAALVHHRGGTVEVEADYLKQLPRGLKVEVHEGDGYYILATRAEGPVRS